MKIGVDCARDADRAGQHVGRTRGGAAIPHESGPFAYCCYAVDDDGWGTKYTYGSTYRLLVVV
jgi:hypothetical protein